MDKLIILLLFVFFIFSKKAHAYLDPGAGSYLIQIAIGIILGWLYLIKNFWKSISSFVMSVFKKLLNKMQ